MINLIDNILKELDTGNYKKAIKLCNELLIKYPGNPAVYELRGICNYNLSLLKNARDDFNKVIELNPEAPDSIRRKIDKINSYINKSPENEIPDFDFASVFKDMPLIEDEDAEKKVEEKESAVKDFDEGFVAGKNLISPDLLKLHNEIEGYETESKDFNEEFHLGNDSISPDLLKLYSEFEYDNFDVKSGFPYDDDRNDFFRKITEPEVKEKSDTELIPRNSSDSEQIEIPAPREETLRKPIPAGHFEIKEPVDTKSESENQHTEKRSLFKSPSFIIFASFAGIFLFFLLAYFLIKTGIDKTNVVTTAKDTAKSTTEAVKDTSKQEAQQESSTKANEDGTESETKQEETMKDEQTKKEEIEEPKKSTTNETEKKETVQETPGTESTMTPQKSTEILGFISDKRKFVMFREADGFWVQVGSFKDKINAQNMLGTLERNGLKAEVTEADLGNIGVFFRVRAGSFRSPEDAKKNTVGLE